MEHATNLLRGLIRIEAVGASPERLLNLCAVSSIPFWDADPIDEITMQMTIHRDNLKRLRSVTEKAQFDLTIVRKRGMPFFLRRFRKRYTLVFGVLLGTLMLMCSSLFIWDIDVTGNETVSSVTILNALDEAGVSLGTYWPSLVSDNIRSRVLVLVPELSWMTVNVQGSKAEVIVREGIEMPEIVQEKAVSNVTAKTAGIITEMNVYRGTALVNIGQTVAAGEVLVSNEVPSPYTETRYVHAMADITARTWYEMTSVCPVEGEVKRYTGRQKTRTSLVFGDSRINFYLNSGIYSGECDKIIREAKLELGGVFTLPVSLVQERYSFYELEKSVPDKKARLHEMEAELEARLLGSVGEDGQIVSTNYTTAEKNGLLYVTLRAECLEQIAVIKEIENTYD